MSILKTARMGHPVLQKRARELTKEEVNSLRIQQLIKDMHETMKEYSGIGLAATQVHESLQLAIIEFSDESERYPNQGGQSFTVFINPKITVLDEALQGYWEGCLSVPELRGFVERPRKVQVDYWDETGKSQTLVAEGFLATVVQHELDHLEGILFVERLRDYKKLMFTEEFERHWAPHIKTESVLSD